MSAPAKNGAGIGHLDACSHSVLVSVMPGAQKGIEAISPQRRKQRARDGQRHRVLHCIVRARELAVRERATGTGPGAGLRR